ncbi:MAG: site-specific integrase [Bacteroidota bacterium]
MEKNQTPATAYVILETRWPNTKQMYKLKLMITFKRIQKFYTIIIPGVPATMSELDFAKTKLDKPRKPFSEYREKFNIIEADARQTITDLPEFSFEAFEKQYFDPPKVDKDLFTGIKNYSNELRKQTRVSTANNYDSTAYSFRKYCTDNQITTLYYNDITVAFLNNYEAWMLKEGHNLTTVGIYLRNIRAILNIAIQKGLFNKEAYPFGKGKFEIPAGRNVKKALTVQDVGKIFNYPAIDGTTTQRQRDYWIFSYLCNGINMKDIARLRYRNIDKDSITFIRAKTERRQRANQKTIVVPLTEEIADIIFRWGNQAASKNGYVFPILRDDITPDKELALIQQSIKTLNKYIRRIAGELKIEKDVSSYTARHSFASVMKQSGASTEFISESLGHSNLATTENYLASFEMETKRKLAKNLLKF